MFQLAARGCSRITSVTAEVHSAVAGFGDAVTRLRCRTGLVSLQRSAAEARAGGAQPHLPDLDLELELLASMLDRDTLTQAVRDSRAALAKA